MSTNTCSNGLLLKTKIVNDVLIIHLSDALSKNAFSLPMAEQLYEAITTQSFKALLLSHEGDFFCSGGHLKFYQQNKSKKEGIEINLRISEILSVLHQLKVPKACSVNGLCLGGGVELLSCFDYIVSTPQSLFGLWQRRIGLTFGWGGKERLAEKISKNNLKNWLLSARTITTYEALELGLINKISFSCHTLSDCLSWLQNNLHWGSESLTEILNEDQLPEKAFYNLWQGTTHMKALKKFK